MTRPEPVAPPELAALAVLFGLPTQVSVTLANLGQLILGVGRGEHGGCRSFHGVGCCWLIAGGRWLVVARWQEVARRGAATSLTMKVGDGGSMAGRRRVRHLARTARTVRRAQPVREAQTVRER